MAEIPQEIVNALAPTKLIATSVISCFLCPDKDIRLRDMRAHIGEHVLLAARNQAEPEHSDVYIGPLPCGFCGQDDAGCLTQLQIGPRGGIKVVSTCPYKYDSMKYKDEKESTDDSPCTNIPIHCPLCPKSASGEPRTIWKYNAVFHLVEEHPQSLIPVRFMKELIIHADEEKKMGIQPANTHHFRQKAGMAGSDDLESMQVDEVVQPLSSEVGLAQGRGRSETVTQTNFSWWPPNK